MKIHELKIYPEYFQPVVDEIKSFEIRRDEGFKVGDILLLWEFNPELEQFTGRKVARRITYITNYAQQQPYVVLAIVKEERINGNFFDC